MHGWISLGNSLPTNLPVLPLYNHNIKVENTFCSTTTGTPWTHLGYYGEVYGDVTLSGDCEPSKNGQTLFIRQAARSP